MREYLPMLIFLAGLGHFSILIATALVPFQLDWREELKPLKRLHRQMYVTYGGYIVMCIVAFGMLSVAFSDELASGEGLARGVCGFIAVFWGVRLLLQAVFDVKEHLSAWWLKLGYHTLTVLFAFFTVVFGYAALFT